MADGGQRLLDVIDDPNALESFLGGLTADSELLPSAETVDNVVASLARSLDENEYEVDSPNETLFDTFDSSSNHLTDISSSYVPSDFGHVPAQNDTFANNLEGFSNGSNVIRGSLPQQHEQQQQTQGGGTSSSGCHQFVASSSNNITSSVISASSSTVSSSTTVTASSNLKQISASVSNCDPSKSTSNFVQTGQILLKQNSISSGSGNSVSYTFSSQDLQQKHNIAVSQNQLNQVTSLSSSVSVEGQIQQSNPSNSTNNLISVVGSGNENGVVTTLTDNSSSGFQIVANQQHQQSGQPKAQNLPPSSSHNTSANNIQVTSGSSSVSSAPVNNDTNAGSVTNATLTSNNVVSVSSAVGLSTSTASAIQQSQQQFIANASTSVNQLVSGQTVSIPSMTVSAPQLIASSQGGLVAASTGQNILQQIQSAGGSQSYIAMEQPTALIATGPTTFGTANVALVATGGTPTYAVLPTTPQFLTNAIIPQSHTIQTLTKAANGAYYQTTGTSQLVATSSVNALQNVNTTLTTASTVTTPSVTSVSSSTESNSSGGIQQTGSNGGNADGNLVTQIIQQPSQQISTVTGSTGTVAIAPQQSFAIGNAASLGQVVVSQVSSLNTMTAPQQAQLTGTIVVNQYGQPMLLPTASTTQAGALQFILRQQPAQPQVLTFQTPAGAATISAQTTAQAANTTGKPIVRYVSQVPQVAQTSGYGLQQIQTANGPTWVAVRYPQVSQASQFGQIQTESIVTQSAAIQSQIAGGQLQIQTQQPQQQMQIQLQQPQNQIIQQTQQQGQIQLQTGLTQSHVQQQQIQVQGAQYQMHSTQQISQTQVQQGQISNAQQLQVQQQQQQQQIQGFPSPSPQSHPQTPVPMDTSSTPVQQNQFFNRTNQGQMLTQSSQSQVQHARDMENQQVSVPDSSSEPPPPKKAKSKSKSSKKKVTLDLEQLLKQSGIMDEDLNDDMSFDFGFGSMDTQPNGLPPSPQVPPAQIPVINTTETPKKSSKKSKSNAKKSPATPLPPPPAPVASPSPSAKPAKKKSPSKKKTPPSPAPPPPLPPPPSPVLTPTKSKSGGSKKKSGNVNETNQKPETKTASSKKTAPPKKISSLDTLLATIDAVAAAAGASSYASTKSQSPPPLPSTPARKPTPSPKSKKSKVKTPAPPAPIPAKTETPPQPVFSSPALLPPNSNLSHTPVSSVLSPITSQSISSTVSIPVTTPVLTSSTEPTPSISSVTPSTRVTGASLTNGNASVTTSQSGLTRVVQTIQLTPQNQQLLRNIQSQIQRLCALPKRSETEQSALQKLVVLQQQVIATGIPVANPAHLNNLAQNVNVESISLASPSATVPSSDIATASSTAIIPLVSLPDSDIYSNPVSSTVTTAAKPILANSNVINSSKPNSSMLSSNGSSPVPNFVGATSGGSSNGAFIVGSPSVSSTASPDSTSNLTNSLNSDQGSLLPPSTVVTNSGGNTSTAIVNTGGMGNIVVSNVKADLGQLSASISVASSEDKNKENTHGKSSFGTAASLPAPTPTSSTSSFAYSQHHIPSSSSYMSSSFSARSAVDDKKFEEQRLANMKAEEEKRARWKKEEFEMLLQRDQQYVVKPDYEVPFSSKKDAVERLMKYHIYRDRNDMNFEEFDGEFGNNAGILLEKFSVMMSKYRNLLLKESMKEVGCAERVMLERMFVSEEKVRLEQDRLMVAQGDVLELPPPPENWVPKIKDMVDKEMMEFEPLDPVVSQQVQSAVDSIIGCESNDTSNYLLEEGDKIEYDAFGVPINSSGYAGLTSASSADIDEAVRSILT